MRKRIIGLIYSGMGLLIAIVPRLTVCPWTQTSGYMRCWKTANAMLILGTVIIIAGAAISLLKKAQYKIAVHSISGILSASGILIPMKFIGGCMSSTMPCQAIAFPVIYVTLSTMTCISVLGIITSFLDIKASKFSIINV